MFLFGCIDKINHKEGALKENPTESVPLQQRLKREGMTVTRRPSLLKTEQEYRSTILTRSTDRAVSLPVERKSYVQDYPPGEKERGYSVQRDQVRFDNMLSYIFDTCCKILHSDNNTFLLSNRTIVHYIDDCFRI